MGGVSNFAGVGKWKGSLVPGGVKKAGHGR